MIHEIGRELETKLLAKGCPFKVLDRETSKPAAWRNAVVLEETGATYGPPRSQSRNAKRYFDCILSATLTVFAQSPKAGAMEHDHRRLAHRVADLSLVALLTIRAERNSGAFVPGAGQFVPVELLTASESRGGVAYVLPFTFERGVEDLTYAGAADDEFTILSTTVSNTTTVDDTDDTTPAETV